MSSNAIFGIHSSTASVLNVIRRTGSIPRSKLPDITHLSQQSIHRITEDLLARDILQLESPTIIGRGKPSPSLALRPSGAFGFGITISSDSVQFSIANLTGKLIHHEVLDVAANDPKSVIKQAQKAISKAIAQHSLPKSRIAGLGISMQGFRSQKQAIYTPPLPLEAWGKIDLEALGPELLELPVIAENNATLGAVAEQWVGAGRHYDNFAYLSFNFGFGGGLVLNGDPYLGQHRNAGEIGAIYSAAEMGRRPALSSLLETLRLDGININSVSELKEQYDPNWPAIDRWLEKITPALNQLTRSIKGILDPAAIVYGGEAPKDLRKRLIGVTENPKTDNFGRPMPAPSLILSKIDDDPTVLGASLLPIRSRFFWY